MPSTIDESTSTDDLAARRARVMGPAYSHFYNKPLHIVRGEGVWLFDANGKRYLDCYNNVPSVGHCHPDVVTALAEQAATLNTHTRYLHENIVEYAEMLADTLPGDLSVCSFVCTGTEANDLAYRMARALTGNAGAICTRGAYHGNSTLVTELSPGFGRKRPAPGYIVDVDPPDVYRGRFGPGGELAYADFVDGTIAELEERGHAPAMMIIDTIFDCAGVHTPPPAYYRSVYEKVRGAGGLIIADEVQSGLTRLGDNVWGFMDAGVIPDIVTMGKPMGDGHPLAVVVTTPAIAEAFARETNYFNTFGGNAVSAAVGKAVLEIVARDNLLENVHMTGEYLLAGLRALAKKHDMIGDIRGKGLFIAVDLVTDHESREPAAEQCARIIEHMRESGVLVAAIGEARNIVKIRPPLVFRQEHADICLAALDGALDNA